MIHSFNWNELKWSVFPLSYPSSFTPINLHRLCWMGCLSSPGPVCPYVGLGITFWNSVSAFRHISETVGWLMCICCPAFPFSSLLILSGSWWGEPCRHTPACETVFILMPSHTWHPLCWLTYFYFQVLFFKWPVLFSWRLKRTFSCSCYYFFSDGLVCDVIKKLPSVHFDNSLWVWVPDGY